MKGSEQHHDLKNRLGEYGDPDHIEMDGDLPEDVDAAIRHVEGDTEIAATLKDAVSKN